MNVAPQQCSLANSFSRFAQKIMIILHQHPYSPDLTSADFFIHQAQVPPQGTEISHN